MPVNPIIVRNIARLIREKSAAEQITTDDVLAQMLTEFASDPAGSEAIDYAMAAAELLTREDEGAELEDQAITGSNTLAESRDEQPSAMRSALGAFLDIAEAATDAQLHRLAQILAAFRQIDDERRELLADLCDAWRTRAKPLPTAGGR